MADKHNYFGDGPFDGDYDELAQSVKRIADKKAKGFMAGWTQEQVTDVSEQMANKSVQDTYISMIPGNKQPEKKIVKPGEEVEENK